MRADRYSESMFSASFIPYVKGVPRAAYHNTPYSECTFHKQATINNTSVQISAIHHLTINHALDHITMWHESKPVRNGDSS